MSHISHFKGEIGIQISKSLSNTELSVMTEMFHSQAVRYSGY